MTTVITNVNVSTYPLSQYMSHNPYLHYIYPIPPIPTNYITYPPFLHSSSGEKQHSKWPYKKLSMVVNCFDKRKFILRIINE